MEKIKPGVYVTRIEHDDCCSYWKTGICNCNPNVYKPVEAEDYIKKGGFE